MTGWRLDLLDCTVQAVLLIYLSVENVSILTDAISERLPCLNEDRQHCLSWIRPQTENSELKIMKYLSININHAIIQ